MTTYINGRPATDWEAEAVERAAGCERARDLERLAGVLAGDDDRHQPRSPDGLAPHRRHTRVERLT